MMNYLKLDVDVEYCMEELSEEEIGRLFTAMLRYAKDGEVPVLPGNERFLWPLMRLRIDHAEEQSRKNRAAYARKKARRQLDGRESEPVRETAVQEAADQEVAAVQEAAAVQEEKASVPAETAPVQETAPVLAEAKAVSEGSASDLAEAAPVLDKVPLSPWPADTEPVIRLPLKDGGSYPVAPFKAEQWRRQYPGANVNGELAKMRRWLLDHPDRQRVKKDLVPFVQRWLDKADSRAAAAKRVPPAEGPSFDLDEIRQLVAQNSAG